MNGFGPRGRSRAAAVAVLASSAAVLLTSCTRYEPVTAAPAVGGPRHVVARGDTLGILALRYGVPVEDLVGANRLRDADRIFVGQSLVIPGGTRPAPVEPALVPPTRVASLPGPLAQSPFPDPATGTPAGSPAPLDTPAGREPRAQATPVLASAAAKAAPDAPATAGATGLGTLVSPRPARPTAMPPARLDPAVVRRAAGTRPPPLSGDGFLWPVAGELVNGFGDKPNGQRNDGVNIAAPAGAPVRAAEHGIVVYAGDGVAGFGNMVLLRHADGFTTAYAHADRVEVKVGEVVRRGQIVARVGATGVVASPQLHFELRSGKTPLDPQRHLTGRAAVLAGAGSGAS